jgi:hypothetical protein
MLNTANFSLKEAFHIYIDSNTPRGSRKFNLAAKSLWEGLVPLASIIRHEFNNIFIEQGVLISTFMTRLLNKRNEPFSEVKGVKSYVRTALKNIARDLWRKEAKHSVPESASGVRMRTVSLDQENEDGRSLHHFIAAPKEEQHNAWNLLSPIQDQLESYLYEQEVYRLQHRTPKGKRTFEKEASLFKKYRDNEYSPVGSPYKKFTRQRTRMLEHLEEKQMQLLKSAPKANQFLTNLAKEHKLEELKQDTQEDLDSTKKKRVIQFHFDLLAFYQYTKGKSYDESDPMAYSLFINAITSLFQEQLYRTQR